MLGFDPYRETDPTQLSFAFDSFAQQRTEQLLLEQLPARIGGAYPRGARFENLFAAITNETPATKEMVRSVLTTLCRDGELIKHGGSGEQRRIETAVRDDDVVMLPKQTRIRW